MTVDRELYIVYISTYTWLLLDDSHRLMIHDKGNALFIVHWAVWSMRLRPASNDIETCSNENNHSRQCTKSPTFYPVYGCKPVNI